MIDPAPLRLSAALLLLGQPLYIVATQFHAGGPGTDHPGVFADYAANGIWTAVHLGQFASMAILLAGLLALQFAVDDQAGIPRWAVRFGAASAAATLALYGTLQAVDGVALTQAVTAWAEAPEPEKAARFASAEAIRWVERGLRSYQDFTLGLALILFATAVLRRVAVPKLIGWLMGLSGLIYLFQGWVAGSEGFSGTQSVAIVLAWGVSLSWMIWLVIIAWRIKHSEPRRLAGGGAGSGAST